LPLKKIKTYDTALGLSVDNEVVKLEDSLTVGCILVIFAHVDEICNL